MCYSFFPRWFSVLRMVSLEETWSFSVVFSYLCLLHHPKMGTVISLCVSVYMYFCLSVVVSSVAYVRAWACRGIREELLTGWRIADVYPPRPTANYINVIHWVISSWRRPYHPPLSNPDSGLIIILPKHVRQSKGGEGIHCTKCPCWLRRQYTHLIPIVS